MLYDILQTDAFLMWYTFSTIMICIVAPIVGRW